MRQSLSTLWAHKLRSFLTMFGIAWGVGSLLLLVGLGEGFRSGQQSNWPTLGQDIMFTFTGRIPAVDGSLSSGRRYNFTYGTIWRLRRKRSPSRSVSPVINREDIRAVSDYGSTNGQVFGVAPEYNQIRTVPVGTGRWFNDEDDSQRRTGGGCGLGTAEEYLSRASGGGSTHPAEWNRFEIIGVLDKVGREGNNGTNARIFIPVETMRDAVPAEGR